MYSLNVNVHIPVTQLNITISFEIFYVNNCINFFCDFSFFKKIFVVIQLQL